MAQGGNDRYDEGSFQNDQQAREYLGRAPNERYAEGFTSISSFSNWLNRV